MRIIYLIMFLGFIAGPSVAQINILKKMEEAAERKVDTVATNIATSAMEKIFSKVLSNNEETQSDSTSIESNDTNSASDGALTAEKILSGFSTSKVDKIFSFDYTFDYLLEGVNDEGKPFIQSIKTRVPDSGEYIQMEIKGIITIVDYTNGKSYTIMNNRIMQFNADRILGQMYGEMATTEDEKAKVTRTNARKEISGYPCVKYLVESDDMESEVWITEKFIMAPDENILAKMDPGMQNFDLQGKRYYPMEIISTDSEGKMHKMTVSNVQKESFEIDLSTY